MGTNGTGQPARAYPTTLDDLDGLHVIPIWSTDEPSLAGVLGVGRDTAYVAVSRGQVPSIRIGRRLLIPTRPLVAMLTEGRAS